MVIEQLGSLASRLNNSLIKEKKSRNASSASVEGKQKFSSVIEEAVDRKELEFSISASSSPGTAGEVEKLLDDIHQTGEALSQDPVFGPLKSYKNAVKQFVSYIIENGMESEEQPGVLDTRTMQRKKYRVIRIIDEKLKNLATCVLKSQHRQMEILARINEINGLLVDLVR